MKKNFISMLLVALMLGACSDDSEFSSLENDNYKNEKAISLQSVKKKIVSQSDVPISVYGYDKYVSKGTVKMAISSGYKIFSGLPNGTYVVEKRLYYKNIQLSEYETFFQAIRKTVDMLL